MDKTHEGMVGACLSFGAVGKDRTVNSRIIDDGTKVKQDYEFIIIAP
jgi:hypothetical protein